MMCAKMNKTDFVSDIKKTAVFQARKIELLNCRNCLVPLP